MGQEKQSSANSRSYYDAFSNTYEAERYQGYHAWLDRSEVAIVRKHTHSDMRLLEAGCGTGLILQALRPHVSQAVGIDLSQGMLQKAEQKKLDVAQAAIHQLPFADNTFDALCSFKVLAHVPPIKETLLEFSRVLRPNGVLIAEFYNPRSFRGLIKRFKRPTPISESIHDEVVYTRYDSLSQIRQFLPESLTLETFYGIRTLTVFSQMHKWPIIGSLLQFLEKKASVFPGIRRLGGFLVVVARKKGENNE